MAQPVTTLRHRSMEAAIFENDIPGTTRKTYNAVITKSYKDKSGAWQKMKLSLNQDQLLEMAQLLEHTFWEISSIKPAKEEQGNEYDVTSSEDVPF